MKRIVPIIVMSLLIVASACKGKGGDSGFPEGFQKLSDAQKVDYMMQHVSADSVARFIIFASLGKIEGVKIDTISNASLRAYENYTDTALQTFSWEFDRVSEELPLHDKMRLRALVGTEDPQGLGLTLGLEYLNQIRVKGMTADQVLEELKELKKACADDPDTYARFVIGFRTVLRYDKNSDMPADIYTKFLDYDEDAVKAYYSRNKSGSGIQTEAQTDTVTSNSDASAPAEAMPLPTDSLL